MDSVLPYRPKKKVKSLLNLYQTTSYTPGVWRTLVRKTKSTSNNNIKKKKNTRKREIEWETMKREGQVSRGTKPHCRTGSVVHCGEYLISYSIFNPFSPALLIAAIISPFDTYTFPQAFIYIYICVSPLSYVHTYTYCLSFFPFITTTICTCIACQKIYCAKEYKKKRQVNKNLIECRSIRCRRIFKPLCQVGHVRFD